METGREEVKVLLLFAESLARCPQNQCLMPVKSGRLELSSGSPRVGRTVPLKSSPLPGPVHLMRVETGTAPWLDAKQLCSLLFQCTAQNPSLLFMFLYVSYILFSSTALPLFSHCHPTNKITNLLLCLFLLKQRTSGQ